MPFNLDRFKKKSDAEAVKVNPEEAVANDLETIDVQAEQVDENLNEIDDKLGESVEEPLTSQEQAENQFDGLNTCVRLSLLQPKNFSKLMKSMSKKDIKRALGGAVQAGGISAAILFGAPAAIGVAGNLTVGMGTAAAANIGIGTYGSVGLATMGGSVGTGVAGTAATGIAAAGAAPWIASGTSVFGMIGAKLGGKMRGAKEQKLKYYGKQEQEAAFDREGVQGQLLQASLDYLEQAQDEEMKTWVQTKLEEYYKNDSTNEQLAEIAKSEKNVRNVVDNYVNKYYENQAQNTETAEGNTPPNPEENPSISQTEAGPETPKEIPELMAEVKQQVADSIAQNERYREVVSENPELFQDTVARVFADIYPSPESFTLALEEDGQTLGQSQQIELSFAILTEFKKSLLQQKEAMSEKDEATDENSPWGSEVDDPTPLVKSEEYDPERDYWSELNSQDIAEDSQESDSPWGDEVLDPEPLVTSEEYDPEQDYWGEANTEITNNEEEASDLSVENSAQDNVERLRLTPEQLADKIAEIKTKDMQPLENHPLKRRNYRKYPDLVVQAVDRAFAEKYGEEDLDISSLLDKNTGNIKTSNLGELRSAASNIFTGLVEERTTLERQRADEEAQAEITSQIEMWSENMAGVSAADRRYLQSVFNELLEEFQQKDDVRSADLLQSNGELDPRVDQLFKQAHTQLLKANEALAEVEESSQVETDQAESATELTIENSPGNNEDLEKVLRGRQPKGKFEVGRNKVPLDAAALGRKGISIAHPSGVFVLEVSGEQAYIERQVHTHDRSGAEYTEYDWNNETYRSNMNLEGLGTPTKGSTLENGQLLPDTAATYTVGGAKIEIGSNMSGVLNIKATQPITVQYYE